MSDVAWSVRGNCALPHYSATYDALHRLKKAAYSERAFDAADNMTERNGLYDEEIVQYDALGNIKHLKRNGLLPPVPGEEAPVYGPIDDLTYSYGGGRLGGVTEAASPEKGFLGSGGGYGYDTAGNMTSDGGKGLDIEYNLLNLPRRIFVAGKGKISFIYDAAGVKQRKVVRDEQDNILLRQKYIGNAEFRNDTLEAVYHDDGRLTPKEDGSWQHEYVLRDHLGNTRVMFADMDDNSAVDETEILQQNHYYPFGHSQEGTWQNTAKNNYLYNGKELNSDFGLNWYAYGFRYYDPVICRFTGVDPIADQFAELSVYNYASNSPVSNIDLHGLQAYDPNSDAYVFDLPEVTITAGNYDYSPQRYDSNFYWGDYQSYYGLENWSHSEYSDFYYSSGLAESWQAWAADRDKQDRERTAVGKMTYFTAHFVPIEDLTKVYIEYYTAGLMSVGPRAFSYIRRGGVGLANAAKGLTNAQLVQKAATKAEAALGGTGRFAGTAKHNYATDLLERYQSIYGNKGLQFKVPFNNGPGNRGVLDVMDNANGVIYDWKFGYPSMTPAQLNRIPQMLKYQRNFPTFSTQIIKP